MKRQIAIAALLFTSAAMYFPTAAQAQVGVNIVIGHPPPPVRYEVVPPQRHGRVWAPGYWDWNGRGYVWISGHWERAHPGRIYQRPEWRHERNGWQLDRGGWREEHHDRRRERDDDRYDGRRDGRHDRDHDRR
jgi:hypothetical protein